MSSHTRARVRGMREQQAKAARRRRLLVIGAVAALLLAALVILVLALRGSTGSDESAAPRHTSNGAVVVGPASAPVHVEVFEDFQCPACRVFEAGASPVLRDVTTAGTARVSYYLLSFIGPESVRAANAAACAADVSPAKFVDLHDALYDRQPAERSGGYTEADLVATGRSVGLGADFARCVRDGEFTGWVTDVNREHGKRIEGTPTVFIDGRELPREDYSPQRLRAAITAAQRS